MSLSSDTTAWLERRDGQRVFKLAALRKSIYSLSPSSSPRYRGFNLFDDDDQKLFEVLCRGEFLIHGFRNRSLRQHLKQFRASPISRLLKRLRLHGIIKKVGNSYKYCLTQLGRHVAIARLTLKNMFLIPEFASAAIAY